MPKAKPKDDNQELEAQVGIDYLGTDGKFHRAEAGDTIQASDLDPKALRWMADAGFLTPKDREG